MKTICNCGKQDCLFCSVPIEGTVFSYVCSCGKCFKEDKEKALKHLKRCELHILDRKEIEIKSRKVLNHEFIKG